MKRQNRCRLGSVDHVKNRKVLTNYIQIKQLIHPLECREFTETTENFKSSIDFPVSPQLRNGVIPNRKQKKIQTTHYCREDPLLKTGLLPYHSTKLILTP